MNSQPLSSLINQISSRFRLTILLFLLSVTAYPALSQADNAMENALSTNAPSGPNQQVWKSLLAIGIGGEVQVHFNDGRSLTAILTFLDGSSFAIISKNKKTTSMHSYSDVKSVKRPSHALRNTAYTVGAVAGILGGVAAAGALEEGLDKAICGNANSDCLDNGALARPKRSR
jgi:hypothetical protein